METIASSLSDAYRVLQNSLSVTRDAGNLEVPLDAAENDLGTVTDSIVIA